MLKAVSGVCALGGRRDNFLNFYMRVLWRMPSRTEINSLFKLLEMMTFKPTFKLLN